MKRSKEEIRRLMIEARARAHNVQPDTQWWWLSFAEDDGFRGVAIVQGQDMAAAIARAHLLKINPGGQVAGWPIPEEFLDQHVPGEFRNRLLSRQEVTDHLKGKKISELEAEA